MSEETAVRTRPVLFWDNGAWAAEGDDVTDDASPDTGAYGIANYGEVTTSAS